jgi:sugar O-acyltransferase (sialic acid O-acetyltransferase NeuD family)
MKKLAFLGSGELAMDLAQRVKLWQQYDVVGFIDGNLEKGSRINDIPVLGNDDDVVTLYQNGLFDYIFIAIGYLKFEVRERLYNRFKGVVPFANIISPSSYVHPSATLGEGIQLSDGTYIAHNAVIEDNVLITLRSIVNHGSHVKKHTYFSTCVTTAGHVTIGERCFIGVGVIISDGITVCDDVWLSPGSIVVADIKKPGQYLSQAARLYNIK